MKKIDNFDTCIAALDFIDSLAKKNKKYKGLLNNTSNNDFSKVVWQVTYDTEWLKD
jgi:hypothetical protein